jgi:hypothetical protein
LLARLPATPACISTSSTLMLARPPAIYQPKPQAHELHASTPMRPRPHANAPSAVSPAVTYACICTSCLRFCRLWHPHRPPGTCTLYLNTHRGTRISFWKFCIFRHMHPFHALARPSPKHVQALMPASTPSTCMSYRRICSAKTQAQAQALPALIDDKQPPAFIMHQHGAACMTRVSV